MMTLAPLLASCSSRSTLAESGSLAVASSSPTTVAPSPLALSRPRAAESLNDWSPRPPRSYARPTFALDMSAELEAPVSLELASEDIDSDELPSAELIDSDELPSAELIADVGAS